MKDIFELTSEQTATTDVRGGTQLAGYGLQPVNWLAKLLDAAKKRHYHAQTADTAMVEKGSTSVIFPYRKEYIAPGDWQANVSENTDVNFTKFDVVDGVEIVPTDQHAGIAFGNRAIRTNALNLIKRAREDLVYRAGDLVDYAVRDAITASANQASISARGAYTVYGGDARAESELSTGDTLTPEMIIDAKTNLISTISKYWVPGTPAAEATSTVIANPWKPTVDMPFVLIVAPEQEKALLKDSQFMNAAEYGGTGPIMTGQILKYAGIPIVSANNTRAFTTSSALDGGSNAGAAGHRCILMKTKTSVGLGWGLKPKLTVFDWPTAAQQRMTLELAYASKVIHKDAICYIDVSDA